MRPIAPWSIALSLSLLGCHGADPVLDQEIPPPPSPPLAQDTVLVMLQPAVPYQGPPGWQLDQPLRVKVQLTDGTPVEGVTVTWGSGTPGGHFPGSPVVKTNPVAVHGVLFPGLTADVTTASSVSDADGIAAMPYAPGFVTGLATVDAVIPGSRVGIPVTVTAARDMKEVAGANRRFCGIDAAGVLSCWQHPAWSATIPPKLTPDRYSVAANTGERYRLIRSVGTTFCALTLGDALHCWDSRDFGPLGSATGALTTPQFVATPAPFRDLAMSSQWPDRNYIAGVPLRICGIEADGTTWCRGVWSGDGTRESRAEFYRLSVRFRQLSLAQDDACGTDLDGLAWCWGENAVIGTLPLYNGRSYVPVRVGGHRHYDMVTPLAAGVCGIESGTNEVYCWGGGFGEIEGKTPPSSFIEVPGRVPGGLRARSLDTHDGWDGRIVKFDGDRRLIAYGAMGRTSDLVFWNPTETKSIFDIHSAVSRGSNYDCYRIGNATGPIACSLHGDVQVGIPIARP